MKIYIEKNVKYGKGYQVRVAGDGGETDVVDFNPYSLKKAVLMAGKALDIINRKRETAVELKEVLEIDKDSVVANGDYDSLCSGMLFLVNGEG